MPEIFLSLWPAMTEIDLHEEMVYDNRCLCRQHPVCYIIVYCIHVVQNKLNILYKKRLDCIVHDSRLILHLKACIRFALGDMQLFVDMTASFCMYAVTLEVSCNHVTLQSVLFLASFQFLYIT